LGVTEISNIEELLKGVPIVLTLATSPPSVELFDVEIKDMANEEL
jgi:hypothetical protein